LLSQKQPVVVEIYKFEIISSSNKSKT